MLGKLKRKLQTMIKTSFLTAIKNFKILILLFCITNVVTGVSQSIEINAGYDLSNTCLDEAQLNAKVINWRVKHSWEHGVKSICFADKNTLFAVGGEWDQGMILKSTDGGHNWIELTNPPDYNFVNKVFFLNPDTGFIVGGRIENLIMKTVNGGLSWTEYYFGYYNALTSVWFTNDSVGFVAGPDVFMKTTDCGINWIPVTLPHYHFSDIFFMDSVNGFAVGYGMYITDEAGKMMKTSDGGETWNEVNLNFNFKLTSVNAINNTVYVTAQQGMILVSNDKFNSWEIMNTGSIAELKSIAFRDPDHGITVGMKGTILTTDDGGLTWKKEYADYKSLQYEEPDYFDGAGNFHDIVFIDDSIGLAAGIPAGEGDSGSFVQQIPIPKPLHYQWTPSTFLSDSQIPNPSVSASQTTEYTVKVSGPDQFIASDKIMVNVRDPYIWAGQDTTLNSTQPYELFGIAEVGKWQTINQEIFGQFNQVQFFSIDTGYAIYQGNLIKTTDGGKTFKSLATHHHLMFNSFYFLNEDTAFAAGVAGLVMKTFDGGESWIDISIQTDAHFESIFFLDTLTGYCCGTDGTIVKTTDGGVTWSTYIIPETETLKKIYFINKNRGFAVGNIFNHRYVFTNDGGISWKKSEYVLRSYDYTDIFFVDDSVGYILGTDLGPLILQKTTDGGITWEERLFVRYDIGSTIYSTIFFTDRYNGYVADYYGEIIRTWDGGKTFYILEKMFAQINDIYFLNANDGFMGASQLRKFHAPADITYQWTPADNVSDPNSMHTFVMPTEPTTYNFIVSREGGCVVAEDIYISPYGSGVNTELENNGLYSIFPNPVSDFLCIVSLKNHQPAYSVKIYNATGVVVFEDATRAGEDRKYSLNPKLKAGLYFVTVTDSEGTCTQKIIVQ